MKISIKMKIYDKPRPYCKTDQSKVVETSSKSRIKEQKIKRGAEWRHERKKKRKKWKRKNAKNDSYIVFITRTCFIRRKPRSSRDRRGEVCSKTFSPNCDPLQVRELSFAANRKNARFRENTGGFKVSRFT